MTPPHSAIEMQLMSALIRCLPDIAESLSRIADALEGEEKEVST